MRESSKGRHRRLHQRLASESAEARDLALGDREALDRKRLAQVRCGGGVDAEADPLLHQPAQRDLLPLG